MENDTVMAQTLLNDDEETAAFVPGAANAEDEPADGADQVASSALPVSVISSAFATSTIDIRLQLQPIWFSRRLIPLANYHWEHNLSIRTRGT